MRGKLAPLLEQWSQAGKSKVTCVKIVRQILKHIGGCTTSGFGPYKKNKFAEFLIMIGIGKVWGYYQETWIGYLSDLWPFPTKSNIMLKCIFPRLTSKQ